MSDVNPRGRPPSLEARRRILVAATELLSERGVGGVTMEGVAARAGVGKPTIYRNWPNAQALAMAALLGPAETTRPLAGTAPLAELREQLARVATGFATRRGRQVTQMLAAAEDDSELAKAFRGNVMLRSRDEGRALIDAAVAAGEMTRPPSIEVTLDLLYGPIFYRVLIGHAPLDRTFTDALFDAVLAPASRVRPGVRRP